MDNCKKAERIIKVIGVFVNHSPGIDMVNDWLVNYSDALQHFIIDNLRDEFSWMTGISIIEAAINIVEDSFENGNIQC